MTETESMDVDLDNENDIKMNEEPSWVITKNKMQTGFVQKEIPLFFVEDWTPSKLFFDTIANLVLNDETKHSIIEKLTIKHIENNSELYKNYHHIDNFS